MGRTMSFGTGSSLGLVQRAPTASLDPTKRGNGCAPSCSIGSTRRRVRSRWEQSLGAPLDASRLECRLDSLCRWVTRSTVPCHEEPRGRPPCRLPEYEDSPLHPASLIGEIGAP